VLPIFFSPSQGNELTLEQTHKQRKAFDAFALNQHNKKQTFCFLFYFYKFIV